MYIMSRFSLYFISDLLWSDKIKAEGSRVGWETWRVFIPGLCRPEKVHLENHKPSPFLQGQPSSQRYRSIIPPIHHRYILSSGPVNLTHCPPKAPQRDCVGRKTFLKPIIPLWLLKYLDTFQEFIAKQLWSKCPCKKKNNSRIYSIGLVHFHKHLWPNARPSCLTTPQLRAASPPSLLRTTVAVFYYISLALIYSHFSHPSDLCRQVPQIANPTQINEILLA